jgi:translation initiation factor 1A
MPKNKIGGKGHKKKKNSCDREERKLIFAEDDQLYAIVKKKLGGPMVVATCSDGEDRMCRIRGKMFKRVWINIEDLILVTVRKDDTEDKKADIIHKYDESEARKLKRDGFLKGFNIGKEDNIEDPIEDEDDIGFDFDDI